jgi:hypothetical protein
MTFAIELYFDGVAESKIKAAWSDLSATSLPSWPLRIGARPHISILVVDKATRAGMDTVFRSVAASKPFQVLFRSADYFDSDEAILFLKPDASDDLRILHNRAVEEARSWGLIPRHYGDEWIPHCTCDYGLTKSQVSIGVSILNRILPLPARIVGIGCVEVTPDSVNQLAITGLQE